MSVEQVTAKQVVAYRVSASLLTERRPARKLTDVLALLVQDTPPGNSRGAVAARIDGDTAAALQTSLEKKTAVGTWSLRGAPMIGPTADFVVLTRAALGDDERSLLAVMGGFGRDLAGSAFTAIEAIETTAAAVEDVLRDGRKPMTKAEVSHALHARLPPDLETHCRGCGVRHVPESLIRAAALTGRFCFGPSEGRRATLVRTRSWLGKVPGDDVERARVSLVRRFLRQYGPTTPSALAGWVGISPGEAKRWWALVAEELVALQLGTRKVWQHRADIDELREPPAATGARLLAAHDPLLELRDRETLVPDGAERKRVWRILGNPGLVLVAGRPVGTWRAKTSGTRLDVTVEPSGRISKQQRATIADEAERLTVPRDAVSATITVAD